MRRTAFWSSLAALATSSFAIQFDAPTPTETPIPNETGVSPKPTAETTLEHRELRRQAGYRSTLENPAFGECGYYGANAGLGLGSFGGK
jgi:hypothetical protein